MSEINLEKFFSDQLSVWPLAAANFRSLKSADVKDLQFGALTLKVQHNPSRIQSTTAKVDEASIAARQCFLCRETRPAEQFHLAFEARKGRGYHIQVNPYPIFPKHLVIARDEHTPQSIAHCFVDMIDLIRKFPELTLFYNGPYSGASAPDHMHFQACPRGLMPVEVAVDTALDEVQRTVGKGRGTSRLVFQDNVKDAECYRYTGFVRGVFALRARTTKSLAKMFYRLLDCAPHHPGEEEPRFNLFAWNNGGDLRVMVIFRRALRSRNYSAEGREHLTMTFGCADLGGVIVAPVREDFEKIDFELLDTLLDDICISAEQENDILWRLTRSQATIDVGIMSAKRICFEIISDGCGRQSVSYEDGRINYNGALYDELYFDAMTPSSLFAEASFILEDVTIGVDFHWQRRQRQKFAGSLKFIVEGDKITAVNIVGLEDYLLSVISSEMKPTASLEFLKAHSIIARSWVLSNLHSHEHFNVCADDHCQRYQGLRPAIGETARRAVDETWGKVLTYNGKVCDTRYSKCCGGHTEAFETCWEGEAKPYLRPVADVPEGGGKPFCDTQDPKILAQVLNDYDLETKDFFEWEQRYSPAVLSELVARRTGIDFGEITDLQPQERGESGRIKYLKIVGTKCVETIGLELSVRRALSESHLKSSAFEVSREDGEFVLRGRGWGHGVGLCQIGAAVMACKGYDYRQILAHYYPGTKIERR